MTTVHVDLRRPQRGTAERAPVQGTLEVGLYRRTVEGDAFVLTQTFNEVLVDGQAVLELAPTNGANAWRIVERTPQGVTRYVAVPSQDAVEYVDLVDLDPATLTPSAEAVAAWDELGDRILSLPAVVALTQTAYDALSPKDSTTLYLITN